MNNPRRVLIVDDSPLVRKILSKTFTEDPRFEVTGTAADPYEARESILANPPDVITLDIEMPKMNGLEFVKLLMQYHPLPVVMVSSYAAGNNKLAILALELGAVDLFCKPDASMTNSLSEHLELLADKVFDASHVVVKQRRSDYHSPQAVPIHHCSRGANDVKVIAIGASTGGTEAIRQVLVPLPVEMPGILVVQHMPESFTGAFANRLNDLCPNLEVIEVRDKAEVIPGRVLVAAGDRHLILTHCDGHLIGQAKAGPLVCRHRPSVQVLFHSVAEVVGPHALGVLLTGMGDDGAHALLKLKELGARTIAQDQETSAVFGMPGEAIALGAAEKILPLHEIPSGMISMLGKKHYTLSE